MQELTNRSHPIPTHEPDIWIHTRARSRTHATMHAGIFFETTTSRKILLVTHELDTCVCPRTHVRAHNHAYTHTHTHVPTRTHTHTHAYTHTHTNTETHAHRRTRIQTHTLTHTATRCNTCQHTTTHYNTVLVAGVAKPNRVLGYGCPCYVTATHCNTLRYTVTCCNTLQHAATHYITWSSLLPKQVAHLAADATIR